MESIASWAAPVFTTIAALMTASNLGSRVTGWGFGVFLAGSILWALLGTLTDQPNLIIQNAILSLLNIFGMWRWLGRQGRIEEGAETAHDKSREAASETLFPVSLCTSATIEGERGRKLGQAVEAMAGCGSGRIAYLVVSEGGIAGVAERLHRLDWKATRVEGDAIRTDLASLETLPRLDRDNWPGR